MHKIRLEMLADYLEIKNADMLLEPSAIIIGRRNEFAEDAEIAFADYGQNLPFADIFPGEWCIDYNGCQKLKHRGTDGTVSCIMEFFEIDDIKKYLQCFVAYCQHVERYGGIVLNHASIEPCHIAHNIRDLLIVEESE